MQLWAWPIIAQDIQDTNSTQRWLDGVQEVIVVSTRVLQLLGTTFENMRSKPDEPISTSSNEGMYIWYFFHFSEKTLSQ